MFDFVKDAWDSISTDRTPIGKITRYLPVGHIAHDVRRVGGGIIKQLFPEYDEASSAQGVSQAYQTMGNTGFRRFV